MATLPACSGKEAVRAFERLGWRVARQSGSHVVLVKSASNVTLSVPQHASLAKGTLRSLIRSTGITVDDFVRALKG